MESEGSLAHSQELSTCSYPELHQSSQCPPPHPICTRFILILFTPYILVFLVVFFLLACPPITYKLSLLPHSCYMSRPSHPLWLHHSNHTYTHRPTQIWLKWSSHGGWDGRGIFKFYYDILLLLFILRLVVTTAGLESLEYGRRNSSRWSRGTHYS
jgi:hypothetical protein